MEMEGVPSSYSGNRKDSRAFLAEEGDLTRVDMTLTSKEAEDAHTNKLLSLLQRTLQWAEACWIRHKRTIVLVLLLVLLAGFAAMVIAACILNFKQATELLAFTIVVVFFVAWDWLMERYGDLLWQKLSPICELWDSHWCWLKWVLYAGLLAALVCWLVLDTARNGTRQLVSFGGLLILILLMTLFSRSPTKIRWRPVFWGIGLQFVFGLLIMRTHVGFTVLHWMGDKVELYEQTSLIREFDGHLAAHASHYPSEETFLSYSNAGAKMAFGKNYEDHFLAFKVMPTVVFVSTIISVLYHVGFMQWLVLKIGFVMHITMGTSVMESTSAAGNIFLGQCECILLIRPYINQLTRSELHAVCVGGFASVSGSILAAYISMGVEASHLLTASVMSAPASLAISKVFWPETEPARVSSEMKIPKGQCNNLLDSVAQGACASVSLVANMIVNLIAFLSILAFLDGVLSWLGAIFSFPQFSFPLICSYVFAPLAFIMGVSWEDSFIVGELIGLKTFLNELVSFERMSVIMKMRERGEPEYVDNVKQYISIHSQTIATYALCGFSNFGSLGMVIGVLNTLAPERASVFSDCGIRALIAGSVSCFMTACIAGLLYVPEFTCEAVLGALVNSSVSTLSKPILECCGQIYSSVAASAPLSTSNGADILRHCCAVAPSSYFNCSRTPG